MTVDPEILKQLIETFKVELDEQLEVITDGLLKLENADKKNIDEQTIFETIFRAAHNIKGTSRGIGIIDLGEIAHHIETLFSALQKHELKITHSIINLSLEAVDGMRLSMKAFVEKSPLPFDLSNLLMRLKQSPSPGKEPERSPENTPYTAKKNTPIETTDQSTLRVSLENLERMTSIVEEIQINKIAIEDHHSAIKQLALKIDQYDEALDYNQPLIKNLIERNNSEALLKLFHSNMDFLADIRQMAKQLEKNFQPKVNELFFLFNALQEEARLLRLVPVSTLLHSFPRYVRDLSQELNKSIDLEMIGEDVKIDKIVLEGLKNPFMHLLRNAIDHGIEAPDVRQSKNKSPTGKVQIFVREEGNKILFDITDDGTGIDAKKISKIAEEKNIMTRQELESLSETEILDLIFRPGFSTKEIITSVSGRGVGLDVVKSNLNDLKGTVTITTTIDGGTTFHLQVPLTLASEHGLMVKSGGQTFVIPTHNVERVISIDPNEIVEVEGSQAIIVDNRPIPLRSLASTLHFSMGEPFNKNQLSIIILKKDRQTVAILVDEIIGEHEIIIKPLQPPLSNIPCLAGGTLASNGDTILVLNANEIIKISLFAQQKQFISSDKKEEKTAEKPHILVVDDSITTRTLEKSILENKNYLVSIAVNGKEAWDLLQKQKFSLLITDVMMPIMDGFTLTERVKQNQELKDMPVIIVTSLGSNEEKKKGIAVGADAYIIKNEFESGALLEIVSQLV